MTPGSKALVVDDSKAIRRILSRTLRELGWEVSEAANGVEALKAMQSNQPPVSLVLVDWHMPVMNGLEFVRHVRTEPRFEQTKLMMVTTETEVEQMVTALESGANEYVMKPFTRQVIEDKLRILGLE